MYIVPYFFHLWPCCHRRRLHNLPSPSFGNMDMLHVTTARVFLLALCRPVFFTGRLWRVMVGMAIQSFAIGLWRRRSSCTQAPLRSRGILNVS